MSSRAQSSRTAPGMTELNLCKGCPNNNQEKPWHQYYRMSLICFKHSTAL